jgi:intracellular septation protein
MSIKQTTAAPTGRKWVKPLTEFGPLVVFFGCYFLFGLLPATAALVAATLAALAVTWGLERRLPLMPVITAVVVAVFGGLTLWLEDETFIKMKPTIVQVIFSLVLLGGLMAGKPLLKPLLGAAWQMDEAGWRKLTLRFAVFFAAMAGLNEAVWRTQTTDVWVTFKVFGILGLTVVFAASQIYLLQRHVLADDGTPGNEEE